MINIHVEAKEIKPGEFPQLKFQTDPFLDAQVGATFLNEKKGGIDFGRSLIKIYPELLPALELDEEKRFSFVQKFVEAYYHNSAEEIRQATNSFERIWNQVGTSFFQVTNTVFEGFQWSPGGYICFTSIFNCNPRFLNTKTFFTWFRKGEDAKTSIAHEMLHFMFYDWMGKIAPETVKELGWDKVWSLSEIFDQLAFEQPEYAQIQSDNPVGYPDLQPLSVKIKEGMKGQPFTMKKFIEIAKNLV